MNPIELLGIEIKSAREMTPDEIRVVMDRYRENEACGEAKDGSLFLMQQRAESPVVNSPLTLKEIRELCEERKLPWRDEYEGRVKRFLASDETVDSYGDIIKADGWDLRTRFKSNPVIMWAHDYYMPPIGSGIKASVENKQSLMIDALFMTADQYPWADTVFKMIDGGFLKGNSVGFIPLKIMQVEDDEERKKLGLGKWGVVFLKQILLEDSVCSIGANPAALVQDGLFVKAVRKGIITKDELERARKDGNVQSAPSDILKSMLDRALVSLNSKTLIVPSVEERKVIPYKKWPLADVDAAWSASAEIKEATTDQLLVMCTWYNADEPDVKGSYKLPHHHVDGYKTNWRAVANAMARLKQTNIPEADRQKCYTHLAKHYKDFDKEPPAYDDLKSFWDMAEQLGVEIDDVSEQLEAVLESNEEGKQILTALSELRAVIDKLAVDLRELVDRAADGAGGESPEPKPKSVYGDLFRIGQGIKAHLSKGSEK